MILGYAARWYVRRMAMPRAHERVRADVLRLVHRGLPLDQIGRQVDAVLSAATGGDLERSLRQREIRRPRGFADEVRVVLSDGTGM